MQERFFTKYTPNTSSAVVHASGPARRKTWRKIPDFFRYNIYSLFAPYL